MIPKNYIIACKPFGFIRMERRTTKKSLKGSSIHQSAAEVIWNEFVMKARKSQLDNWFGTTDLELIKTEIEANIMVLEIADVSKLSLFVMDYDKSLIIREKFKNLKTRNKHYNIVSVTDTLKK